MIRGLMYFKHSAQAFASRRVRRLVSLLSLVSRLSYTIRIRTVLSYRAQLVNHGISSSPTLAENHVIFAPRNLVLFSQGTNTAILLFGLNAG